MVVQLGIPQPALRIVCLILHAQQGADFFGDTAEARTVGALRSQGHSADLVHVHYPRGDQAAAALLNAQLLHFLADTLTHVVVVGQLWNEGLLGQLQAQGQFVICTDAYAQWQQARPAAQLAHFPQHRAPLLQLLQTLREGTDPLQVPNVALATPAGWMASRVAPQPVAPLDELREPFAPAADTVVFGHPRNLDGTLPPVRKTLDTNTGCPFSDDVTANPLYAGAQLSEPTLAAKGCAFCFMGGDYRALPVAETVHQHVAQIRYWQEHLPRRPDGSPGLQEVVLRDQAALRYLPQLVQACQQAQLAPVGLLVPGRGDAILRYGKELVGAAELCGDSGWWFTIYLIGFESFSQPQLDLYNKGVTVADYALALQRMRGLHRVYPQAFRMYAHGASSFILFNPWTTLDDLDYTTTFCDDHAVGELAHGLSLSRLRLYPNLPLYWLAQRDGLLQPGAPQPDRGAAFAGYAAEAEWRYRDGRVGIAEALHRALADQVRPDQSVGLLRAVVRWVRHSYPTAQSGQEGLDADTVQGLLAPIVQNWQQLRGMWQPVAGAAGGLRLADQRPQRATLVAGRTCNNRCRTCVANHAELVDQPERLRQQASELVGVEQVVLAGREPTMLPELVKLLRTLRKTGATQVEALSNGRLLATPGIAAQLKSAGLTRVSIKRHRMRDVDEDLVARSPGAGRQACQAIAHLGSAQLPWSLHWLPVPEGWAELPQVPPWAAAHGARDVQVQILAAEVDLAALPDLLAALRAAAAAAETVGIRWSLEGF